MNYKTMKVFYAFLFLLIMYWGACISSGVSMKYYIVPIPELMLIFMGSMYFYLYSNRGGGGYLLGFVSIIYLFQCLYYSITGEFISSLALENINQFYLVFQPIYVVGIISIFVVVIILYRLCFSNMYIRRDLKSNVLYFFVVGICVSCFFCILVQNSIIGQRVYIFKYLRNETPIFSFVRNIYNFFGSDNGSGVNVDGYPYEKDKTYITALKYPIKKNIKPNVILIFTEGTSARLLGCYGGQYLNLTPHIDDFSSYSMRVYNYFNHTAATFRGTQGQLASIYPHKGGYDANGGWAKNSTLLSKRNYQTIPKILNNTYNTVFLSPHAEKDPYTALLINAGFSFIYTRDTLKTILNYTPELYHESIQDKDMYMALINYLKDYKNDKPFFISMYTFDTHVGIDVPSDNQKYNVLGKNNEVLNTLHECDFSFGKFWNYFKNSPYKDNTIIIFTSDHAHHNDKFYVSLVEKDKDYVSCFFDKIPLIIYDPIHELPKEFDANDNSSLALAPTICHLLGIQNVRNNFLGTSIFEQGSLTPGVVNVVGEGENFFAVYNHRIHKEQDIEEKYMDDFWNKKDEILKFYTYESANKVFHE